MFICEITFEENNSNRWTRIFILTLLVTIRAQTQNQAWRARCFSETNIPKDSKWLNTNEYLGFAFVRCYILVALLLPMETINSEQSQLCFSLLFSQSLWFITRVFSLIHYQKKLFDSITVETLYFTTWENSLIH
jgi:hypothetical protein